MSKVRVRFAPSPTGGLHLGGVRTALFNYLFAKKHGGEFILRIEDTDQTRFVPGAEAYIFECLKWCGIEPDESVQHGGTYGSYRQSERKESYRSYAEQLIKDGYAYYAFDTPEELETMRETLKAHGSNSLQYDHSTRVKMRNSFTLTPAEIKQLIDNNTPYVIRIRINPDETFWFTDLIRGEIHIDTNNVDDKVLLKADGMPTYHLAVVVDDYLMKITHAFRGEEWLPSAPVHILLWKYLFGLDKMPQWAHLPLILKPDGNGKLSKRDGDRLGFPVYAMDWKDPVSNEITKGFKEIGFLPEAFINLLAVLGWNDGTEQEIFSKEELVEKFSLERVHKAGAKFDFEKAKWFNHEWIKKDETIYLSTVKELFNSKGIAVKDDDSLRKVVALIKDRCPLLTDFYEQGIAYFEAPRPITLDWNEEQRSFYTVLLERYTTLELWQTATIEGEFKKLAVEKNLKLKDLFKYIRLMLTGKESGPSIFALADFIGKEETISRMKQALL
jgi:glutamyl-tRNA synthetase